MDKQINPVIKLENINKSYKIAQQSLHVLQDISLTVNPKDYLAILGASGSGKSTLMNIIGCMDIADSGSYYLDGVDVMHSDEDQLSHIRNAKIGFIFQKYHLIPQYDVLQNVLLPLLVRGMERKKALEIAAYYLEMVGLWNRIHHKPNELSGGQQQRVAIARALVTSPALLLADEPTGALDSATGLDILNLFHQLNDNGHTIIMITHDLQVANHSKRIVNLMDGKIT